MRIKNFIPIFTFFSAAYLVIEIQAWFFLSKVYHAELTLEELSKFERFGYASAAIGVTLVFLRVSFHKVQKKAHLTVTLLCAIPVYLTSLWGVYEVVERVPDWIPNETKPAILTASVKTLDSPDWKNLLAVFNGDEKPLEKNTFLSMQENFRTPDRQVQSIYIDGLRTLAMFSDYYERSAEMMEPALWDELWRSVYLTTTTGSERNFNHRHLDQRLRWFNYWSNKEWAPHQWTELAGLLVSLNKNDPVLFQLSLEHLNGNQTISSINTERYRNELRKSLSWNALGEQLEADNWPIYNLSASLDAQFQSAYSRLILDRYTHLPDTLVPWYNGNPLETRTYYKAAAQVAPFLFNESGDPVLTLSKVYDDDIRFQYVGTLRRGLPLLLREHWGQYQVRALRELSSSEKSWLVPSNAALHKKWLRAGIVVPVMLLLSALLIVANIVILARQSIVATVVSVSAGVFIVMGIYPSLSEYILTGLLKISVSEAKIFLY